jgi:tetratricopeptide (TPR) repeat protein
MGRLVEAIDCFDKILELNHKDSEAWAWKAEALLCQDKYVEAISCFDKAIALSPRWEFPIEAREYSFEQIGNAKKSSDER